jgi:hypothetical protein
MINKIRIHVYLCFALPKGGLEATDNQRLVSSEAVLLCAKVAAPAQRTRASSNSRPLSLHPRMRGLAPLFASLGLEKLLDCLAPLSAALLDSTDQLIQASLSLHKIVVRDTAPFALDFSTQLLDLAF